MYEGKLISHNGKVMNMLSWAKQYDITPSALTYSAKRLGSIESALKYYDNKVPLGYGIRDVYEYTGEAIALENGKEIHPGMVLELGEWCVFAEMSLSTMKVRLLKSLCGKQEAFNIAISTPINKSKVRFKNRYISKKRKNLKKSSLQILQCRTANPHKRCVGCEQQSLCF